VKKVLFELLTGIACVVTGMVISATLVLLYHTFWD